MNVQYARVIGMDILSLVIGAILGVIMSNYVNQDTKRIKANSIHTYLLQLYILAPIIAFVGVTIEQKLYSFLTSGRFGYNVYIASHFWYTYMTKGLSALIFVTIAYWYIFIFYKKSKVLYGKHKSITLYLIYSIIIFTVFALYANVQIIFNKEVWQYDLLTTFSFILIISAMTLIINALVLFCKENHY